jgi:hypothetical protein
MALVYAGEDRREHLGSSATSLDEAAWTGERRCAVTVPGSGRTGELGNGLPGEVARGWERQQAPPAGAVRADGVEVRRSDGGASL